VSTCLKNIILFRVQGLIVFYWFRSEVLDFDSNVNYFFGLQMVLSVCFYAILEDILEVVIHVPVFIVGS